jgi:Family of unknown function (DUF6262)
MTSDRTAAAIEARRRGTQQKLQQVRDAITELRRRKTAVTYPAVARRAGVSRTFLYDNAEARALIGEATRQAAGQRVQARAEGDARQEASWRERALNAEAALATAHAEIRVQRDRIAVLLGRSATWNTNGRKRQRSGSPPRTPRSSSASASSPNRFRCARRAPGDENGVRTLPADVGWPWLCKTVQQIDAGVPSFGCPPVASRTRVSVS